MDTSPPSPTSLRSSIALPPLSPPAYSAHPAAGGLWEIKNAKYQSIFTMRGNASVEDLREHVGYIKDPHFISAVGGHVLYWDREATNGISQYGPSHEQPNRELPDSIKIQYNRAFCHLSELLDKFQECIGEMSPLKEEDLLFLLLRRFSDASDATVYAEIRRPEHFQIYDSTIKEPLVGQSVQRRCNNLDMELQESTILEGSLSHDTSVINADLIMNYSVPHEERTSGDISYTLLPQTPPETDSTCVVTVNFPAVIPIETSNGSELPVADLPEYSSPLSSTEVWPEHDWAQLPSKFQPPSFRIHRCHHSGVERGGEDEAFQLPLGFPEIVQHMEEACEDVFST
ncbi:hypothetical protein EJ07DRAFT_152607 [Lizonia empirigonia]|nr:hypothetical protein EJ07DRAFT_152607 [Lizonia empirigonia]